MPAFCNCFWDWPGSEPEKFGTNGAPVWMAVAYWGSPVTAPWSDCYWMVPGTYVED